MTDDLDLLAQSLAIPAQKAREVSGSLNVGLDFNPDEYAKAMSHAARFGVEPSAALEDPAHFDRAAKLQDINPGELVKTHPKTAEWVSVVDHAALAQDDLGSLINMEDAFSRAKRVQANRIRHENYARGTGFTTSMGAKVAGSINRLIAMPGDMQDAVMNATIGRLFGAKSVKHAKSVLDFVLPLQRIIHDKAKAWADEDAKLERSTEDLLIKDPKSGETFWNADAVKPWTASGLENIAGMLASEAAPMAAQIMVTAATGGAAAPTLAPTGGRLLKLSSAILRYAKSPAGMIEVGRTVQGQYESGVREVMDRNPGLTEEEAKIKVAPGALLAGVFSSMAGAPMEGKIIEDLLEKVSQAPGGKSLVRRIASRLASTATTAGKEGAQEISNGIGEDLAEWITYNPDKTLKEAAANAVMNFVGGAAMGGATGFAMHGANVQENRSVLDAVGQAAANSKLLQRSPDAFGNAIAAMTENGEVGIPAEQFTTYFQSKGLDPVQVAAELKVKNLQEAMAAGTDVILPVAELVKATEHFEALKEDIRLHPEDPTEREYREMEAAYQKEQDALEEQAQAETQGNEDLDYIQQDLTQKLVAVGVEQGTAEAYAQGELAKWRTLAERTGISPRETYDRYGFTFSTVAGEKSKKSILDMVKDRLKSGGVLAAQMWQSAKDVMGEVQTFYQPGGGRFANAKEKRAWRAKKAGQMTQASMDKAMDKAMTEAHEAEEAEFRAFEDEVLAVQAGDIHGEDKRGFIQIGADQKIHIGLLENRDLSTVLHELGHAWLEITADIAEQDGTPQEFKDSFQALLKKLGVESRDQITTEHHEKFAEWHEAYLLEGKAPSPELRGLFQRFKAWMKLVYGSLTGLGVKLSPEVRDYFDRLYATDQEIEAASKEMDTTPLFATAKDAGMTDAQFERYTKAVRQQIEHGREALDSQLLREAKREKEQWWKTEKANVREAVTQEVDARPEYLTLAELQDGETKLSAAEVERQFGKDALKRLPKGATVAEGGVDAETAAMALGYDSGAELVEALSGLESRERLINRETDARMRELHGDLRLDGTIADAAKEALHNEAREDALLAELRAIRGLQRQVTPIVREAVGVEREKGKAAVQAEREKGKAAVQAEQERVQALKSEARDQKRQAKASLAAVPKIETFRNAARSVVESTKVMDLKPYRYLLAERKHARIAVEAMAKGDHAAAADAKSKQILNHCLYLESTKALEEVAKIQKKAKKGMGTAVQSMLGKAGKDYQEAYNALLARFSFDRVSNKAIQESNAAALLFDALNRTHEDAGIDIDPMLLSGTPKNFREASVTELRALKEALANIEHVARETNRVMVGKAKADLEETVGELISTALKHNEAKPVKPSGSSFTAAEKAGRKLKGLAAHLKQMVRILDQLDGGDADGMWHRAFWQPISDAMGREADLGAAVNKRLQAIIEKRGEFTKKYLDTSIGVTLPGESVPMNRRQAITFLLNLGTEENRNAMLGGYKLIQGDGGLHPVVTEILSKLTKEEVTFAQDIWNVLESMWPAVEDLEMRVKGIAPKRKTETGFTVTTRDGETVYLKGGYFPQVGEPLDKTGKRQESGDLSQIFEQGYTRATTNKSHTKQVTGATYRVNLDFAQVLGRHLPSVIKDITHREAVLSINRLLNQPEVSRVIQETMGPEYEAEFLPWLKATVNNRNAGPQEPIFSALMGLRHRMVIAQLGFSLSSLVVQVTDAAKVTTEVPAKYLARAYAELMRSPKETVAMIRELSPNRMAHFEENYHRDLMQWFESQDILERKKNRLTEIGMSGFHFMGQLSAFPAWLGAYQQGMAEHGDQDKAVREADVVVDRVIQMGNPANLSRVMRDKGAMNLFTTFQGDMNIWFNILASAVGEKNGKRLAKGLLAYFMSGIIGNLLVGRGPKDDEEWYEWATLKGLIGIPELVPFVGDLAKMGLAKAQGKPVFNQQFSPVFTAMLKPFVAAGEIRQAATEGDGWDDAAFSTLDAAGTFAGLPGTAQTLKTSKYLNRLSEGEERPDHAGDVAMGVLFGKRK